MGSGSGLDGEVSATFCNSATVQQVGCTEHCTAILHSALHSAELFTFECPQLNILLRLMPAHASYCHQSSIARPAYARALYIQHHSVHKSDEILCKSTCSIAHIFCRIILGKKGKFICSLKIYFGHTTCSRLSQKIYFDK